MLVLITLVIYVLKGGTQAAPTSDALRTQLDPSSLHHWQPRALASTLCDCSSSNDQRSVWDIVGSCLAVIFTCTWVVIHPNMPDPSDGFFKITLRRLRNMLWCLIAPEVMVTLAMRQWVGARKIADFYKDRGWTMTHGFFLQMGGFKLYKDEKPIYVLWFEALQAVDKTNVIDFPTITASEIEDRSKGDGLSKGFVVLQTSWFIIQCIARKAQGLPITELEIVTLAFATLNAVMYALWWRKPLNVRFPVRVYFKPPLNIDFRQEETINLNSAEKKADSKEFIAHQESSSINPVPDSPINTDETSQNVEPTSNTKHPESDSWFSRVSSHLTSISLQLYRSLKLQSRLQTTLQTLGLRCAWIWSMLFEWANLIFFRSLGHILEGGDLKPTSYMTRLPTYYALQLPGALLYRIWILSSVIAMVFGAIHCIAWTSAFPSTMEQTLWRVGSTTILCVPLQLLLLMALNLLFRAGPLGCFMKQHKSLRNGLEYVLVGLPYGFICIFYVLSRLFLIIEAFVALRALPPAAYEEVAWTNFIPHV